MLFIITRSRYFPAAVRFANREEALAWICKNQLGRRNLSPKQKRYLLGKQYESEKKAEKIFHGNQYTLAKKSGRSHDDMLPITETLK